MTSSSASQQSLFSTMSSTSTSQRHLQSVKPVFIKDKDIGDSSTTPLFMCNAITRVINSSKLDGVQRINNLWRIYLKDNATRLELTVKQEIRVNGKSIPLYDQNPYVTYPGLPVQKKDEQWQTYHQKLTLISKQWWDREDVGWEKCCP